MEDDFLNPPKAQNYSSEAYDQAALRLLDSGQLDSLRGADAPPREERTPFRFGAFVGKAVKGAIRSIGESVNRLQNPATSVQEGQRLAGVAGRVGGSAAGRLVNDAADNIVGAGAWAVGTAAKAVNTVLPGNPGDTIVGEDFIRWHQARQQDRDAMSVRIIPQRAMDAIAPQGVGEELATGALQFALPFIATGGLSLVKGGVTLAEAGSLANGFTWRGLGTKLGVNAMRNLITDVGFFDAYDHRLSNVAEDFGIHTSVTGFLQAKPNDTQAEAVLKQSLESFLFGNAIDVTLDGLRFLRAGRVRKSAEEAVAALDQLGESMARQADEAPFIARTAEDGSGQVVANPRLQDRGLSIREGDDPGLVTNLQMDNDELIKLAQNAERLTRDPSELVSAQARSDLARYTGELEARGYTSSRSAAAKALEGTKVTDARGKPRTVYHGSTRAPENLDVRMANPEGAHGPAHYFSESPEVSNLYAEPGNLAGRDAKPNVRMARLSIQNPLDLNAPVDAQAVQRLAGSLPEGADPAQLLAAKNNEEVYRALTDALGGDKAAVNQMLQSSGYDGLTHTGSMGAGTSPLAESPRTWVAFKNEQVHAPFDPLEPIQFKTPMEAQRAAEIWNDATRIYQQPRGSQLSEGQLAGVRAVAARIQEAKTVEDVIRLTKGTDFNFNYFQSPDEARAQIEAISEVLAEQMAKTRQLGTTWEVTRKLGEDLISGVSGDQFLAAMRRLRIDTQKLPAYVLSSRMYLNGAAQRVAKLSKVADAAPDNVVAYEQLMTSIQHLFEVQDAALGLSSDVARALNIHQAVSNGNEVAIQGALRTLDDPLEHADGALATAQDAQAAAGRGLEGEQAGKAAAPETPSANGSAPKPAKKAKAPKAEASATPPPKAPRYPWIIEGLTEKQIRGLARRIRIAGGDPKAIRSLAEATQVLAAKNTNPALIEKIVRYRMEAMLSGSKTLLINAISNAATAMYHPAELMYAGFRTKNPALRQQGWDLFMGNFLEMRESWSAAKKAFDVGNNLLDSESIIDTQQILHPDKTGKSWLSKMFSAPSRYLMATDEFFKNLNYRSHVRSSSLRRMASEGITDAEAISRQLAEDMEASFNPFQSGQAVDQAALDYAKYNTFQNSLEPGSWVAKLQEMSAEHPYFRLLLPFVKTPVNLFKFWAARTPGLSRFVSSHMADLAAGGERAAVAQARSEMGLMVYGTAAALAFSGSITGRGPSDPRLRKQMRDNGWPPYSIKVPGTDTWLSYRRADPIMTSFGMVADFVQISSDLGEVDAEDIGTAMLGALTSNLASKTFYQGMVDAMDAFTSGDGYKVSAFLEGFAGSFVPNLLNQTNPDDTLREVNSILDAVMARIPGFSEMLEPHRNILGEPVLKAPGYLNRAFNPFTAMIAPSSDDVAFQMIELGKAMSMPSPSVADGKIDLRDPSWGDSGQTPYDRWQELVSESGLRERLEKLMASETWKNASTGDNTYAPGGKRFLLAARVIQKYQQRAKLTMYREYPRLQEAVRQVDQLEALSIRKGPEAVEAFLEAATQ